MKTRAPLECSFCWESLTVLNIILYFNLSSQIVTVNKLDTSSNQVDQNDQKLCYLNVVRVKKKQARTSTTN